jgi:hypothetical protein
MEKSMRTEIRTIVLVVVAGCSSVDSTIEATGAQSVTVSDSLVRASGNGSSLYIQNELRRGDVLAAKSLQTESARGESFQLEFDPSRLGLNQGSGPVRVSFPRLEVADERIFISTLQQISIMRSVIDATGGGIVRIENSTTSGMTQSQGFALVTLDRPQAVSVGSGDPKKVTSVAVPNDDVFGSSEAAAMPGNRALRVDVLDPISGAKGERWLRVPERRISEGK